LRALRGVVPLMLMEATVGVEAVRRTVASMLRCRQHAARLLSADAAQ
jgi:hypothetical protein